jgi:hypothetical protein
MAAILTGLLCLVLVQGGTPQPQTNVRPSVELEKTRFVSGERVFFWLITSRDPGDTKPIPAQLMGSGRVIFTRPDGTERIDVVSAPIDGMGINQPGDMGWKGGWSLRDQPIQLGRWTLVYEFAGYRSKPVTFTVEDLPVLKDIHASFEFPAPLSFDDANAAVTFVVRNESHETIRFVERGQNAASVSFQIQGAAGNLSAFVPESVLVSASGHAIVRMMVDVFNWDALKLFPFVTLAPGETYRLRLPLMAAVGRSFGSGADIAFSTELQLLIGEPGGQWKDFSPIRLQVTSASKY